MQTHYIYDKINGLLSGGDDYITKPFSLRELEARIVTNIKREERHQQKTEYRFMDEMPVSYTHLDVYKRQGSSSFVIRSAEMPGLWKSHVYE